MVTATLTYEGQVTIPIEALKGMLKKPVVPVSVEDMNWPFGMQLAGAAPLP